MTYGPARRNEFFAGYWGEQPGELKTSQSDVVDIVEADHPAEAEKAAMLIRCYGHATTETMHATPWKEFIGSM
jgi:hypothetical protein